MISFRIKKRSDETLEHKTKERKTESFQIDQKDSEKVDKVLEEVAVKDDFTTLLPAEFLSVLLNLDNGDNRDYADSVIEHKFPKEAQVVEDGKLYIKCPYVIAELFARSEEHLSKDTRHIARYALNKLVGISEELVKDRDEYHEQQKIKRIGFRGVDEALDEVIATEPYFYIDKNNVDELSKDVHDAEYFEGKKKWRGAITVIPKESLHRLFGEGYVTRFDGYGGSTNQLDLTHTNLKDAEIKDDKGEVFYKAEAVIRELCIRAAEHPDENVKETCMYAVRKLCAFSASLDFVRDEKMKELESGELKKERIEKMQIATDELTGSKLEEEAAFHHLYPKTIWTAFEYVFNIDFGKILNKVTHKVAHFFNIHTPEMFENFKEKLPELGINREDKLDFIMKKLKKLKWWEKLENSGKNSTEKFALFLEYAENDEEVKGIVKEASALKNAEDLYNEAKAENNALKEQIASQSEQIASQSEQIASQSEQIASQSEQIASQSEQISNLEKTREQDKAENEAKLEAQKAEFEKTREQDKAENEAKLEAQKAESKAREEQMKAEFEAKLEAKEAESKAREEQMKAELKEEMKQMIQNQGSSQEQAKATQEQVSVKDEQNKSLQESDNTKDEYIKSLEEQLKTKDEQLKAKVSENDVLKEQLKTSQEQLKAKDEIHNAVFGMLHDKDTENKQLKEENVQLKEQVTNLIQQNEQNFSKSQIEEPVLIERNRPKQESCLVKDDDKPLTLEEKVAKSFGASTKDKSKDKGRGFDR